jgi:hypothetical protein
MDSKPSRNGNAPFVVDRDCGSIHVTGTAYPTEAIPEATGKDLAEAKNCTDLVLAGKPVSLTLATAAEADKFCAVVQGLGVFARRETRYH